VGLLSGLFGIGGGVLLVVGLVAFGFAQHAAHATSLAAIILTAAAAVIPFALEDAVALPAGAALALGAAVGAVLGAAVMRRIPERALQWTFAALLTASAARMLVGVEATGGAAIPHLDLGALALCTAVGLVTGIASSILGVGGGVIMVPVLVLGFGFSQHAAEGTSLAVVIPTALIGALRHHSAGYTDWRTGLLLGGSGVAGGLLGARIALGLDALLLQRLFGVLLLLMVARTVWPRPRPEVEIVRDGPEEPADSDLPAQDEA